MRLSKKPGRSYGNTGRIKDNGVIIYFFDTFCFNRFGQRSVIQTFVLKQETFIVYSWFERKFGKVRKMGVSGLEKLFMSSV